MSAGIIFAACESGDLEQVREIVRAPDFPRQHLDHGLLAAVSRKSAPHGYPELVGFLLEQGADATKLGGAPVHCKSKPVLQLLVDHGWDVNAGGDRNAAFEARLDEDILRWLIDRGADLNAAPNGGSQDTVLDAVARYYSLDMFQLCLDHGADMSRASPLQSAGSKLDTLEYLLGLGLDINEERLMKPMPAGLRPQRATPLSALLWCHKTVTFKKTPNVNVVRWLLDHGAKVNEKALVDARVRAKADNDSSIVDLLEAARLDKNQ